MPFSVFPSLTGILCSEKPPVPSHALRAPSAPALHHDVFPLAFIGFFFLAKPERCRETNTLFALGMEHPPPQTP